MNCPSLAYNMHADIALREREIAVPRRRHANRCIANRIGCFTSIKKILYGTLEKVYAHERRIINLNGVPRQTLYVYPLWSLNNYATAQSCNIGIRWGVVNWRLNFNFSNLKKQLFYITFLVCVRSHFFVILER